MIEKEFLKTQMQRLENNYGKDKFKITKAMFDLWYEFFSDYSPEGIKASVDEYIITNEFPPNIAGINNIYARKKAYRQHMQSEINAKYRWMASWFNENFDKETKQTLIDYVYIFPQNRRESALTDIAYDAVNYWNDCNDKIIPISERKTIKDFVLDRINEVKNER